MLLLRRTEPRAARELKWTDIAETYDEPDVWVQNCSTGVVAVVLATSVVKLEHSLDLVRSGVVMPASRRPRLPVCVGRLWR